MAFGTTISVLLASSGSTLACSLGSSHAGLSLAVTKAKCLSCPGSVSTVSCDLEHHLLMFSLHLAEAMVPLSPSVTSPTLPIRSPHYFLIGFHFCLSQHLAHFTITCLFANYRLQPGTKFRWAAPQQVGRPVVHKVNHSATRGGLLISIGLVLFATLLKFNS